jgi:peptidyl-prolyl cis-trans isomerase C
MSCSVQSVSPSRKQVRVNAVAIPRDVIAREAQHHPADKPTDAWMAAARALVIRELLLQEAGRLGVAGEPLADGEGRRETSEEASIRALIEQEVRTPTPDEAACLRYFEQNRRRFRSSDLYEVAHILLAVAPGDQQALGKAKEQAPTILAALADEPHRFADLARAFSACPSAAQGGNLGQIGRGQTAPEFDRAMAALEPGSVSEPVRTRYGLHIIRMERRIEGADLPFEAVRERIMAYLAESVTRQAISQYVQILANRAEITGVQLVGGAGHLHHA